MGKRELIALLNLSSRCPVMVERLFLAVPRGCLQFVIVVFPDHTHLLFFISDPFIVSKFHYETHDPKGQENKIYTIVKGKLKSRLIGHGIDMGQIQPLPPTSTTHTGEFAVSDCHEAQCLTLKKVTL